MSNAYFLACPLFTFWHVQCSLSGMFNFHFLECPIFTFWHVKCSLSGMSNVHFLACAMLTFWHVQHLLPGMCNAYFLVCAMLNFWYIQFSIVHTFCFLHHTSLPILSVHYTFFSSICCLNFLPPGMLFFKP